MDLDNSKVDPEGQDHRSKVKVTSLRPPRRALISFTLQFYRECIHGKGSKWVRVKGHWVKVKDHLVKVKSHMGQVQGKGRDIDR